MRYQNYSIKRQGKRRLFVCSQKSSIRSTEERRKQHQIELFLSFLFFRYALLSQDFHFHDHENTFFLCENPQRLWIRWEKKSNREMRKLRKSEIRESGETCDKHFWNFLHRTYYPLIADQILIYSLWTRKKISSEDQDRNLMSSNAWENIRIREVKTHKLNSNRFAINIFMMIWYDKNNILPSLVKFAQKHFKRRHFN